MKYLILTLFALFSLLACKQKETNTQPEQVATQTNSANNLSPLSRDEIYALFESADYVDYIFFDYDFSMNQGDPNAVKAAVTFISDQLPPQIPSDCKATGRIIFQSKGEIVLEADMYYRDNCHYYQFVDSENRPAHRNQMTDQGIAFYDKMFSQALQQPGQAPQ